MIRQTVGGRSLCEGEEVPGPNSVKLGEEYFRCAAERRGAPAGAKPVLQLPLGLTAAGAVCGGVGAG